MRPRAFQPSVFWALGLLSAGLLSATPALAAPTKLLRFPDLHADRVVFTYAGDLWTAPADGGGATRLTSHPGLELFAKFSPDGKTIAFTGQYDGDEQVYVIPSTGGVPQQLTHYPALGPLPPRWGYDHQVYGWTPDGSAILFRSWQDSWDLGENHLFTVPAAGGMPTRLPMPTAGAGDFAPDGKRVVYSPLFRDFRHWKRYQGGWAQDLYLFDLTTLDSQQVTNHPRSDRDPMWIGDHVYFSSDRTGTLNLYRYDPQTQATEQLTHSTVWDVRWPSADHLGQRIVYELNGELVIFDLKTQSEQPLAITVPSDGVAMRPTHLAVGEQVEDMGLAPRGQRAVFSARGDLFSAPIEHGPVRNLTRSSGAHDREPSWSPDGAHIAMVSDLDGEEAVYLVSPDGHGEPRRIVGAAEVGPGHYGGLTWSPNSKLLAFRDQHEKLFVVDIASRQLTPVADDRAVFGLTYSWSPDSRFLAYSIAAENGFRTLFIWSAAENKSYAVSDDFWNSFSPAFSPNGDYLYFLSDREFAPQIDGLEFNFLLTRSTYIYALALRRDLPHPFPPQSDEVDVKKADSPSAGDAKDKATPSKKTDKKKATEAKKDEATTEDSDQPKPVQIDFAGLADRVARVPVPADNYAAVVAVKDGLVYFRVATPYYGRSGPDSTEVRFFAAETRKETTLASGIDNAEVSPDGSQLILQRGNAFERREAAADGETKPISTAELAVDLVPAAEWEQIFNEVWRRFRDYFYVDNMHGYDWAALRERYRPWLAHVGHRSDLNYLLSEMIAELNVSHAYVSGGDFTLPDRPHAALLGARFELDPTAGRYRIAKIFAGQNQEDRYRSPLTEVGVDVHAGDYLLAVNGVELVASRNPFELLRHAGNSTVELTVNAKPELAGARRVTVNPIADEDDLLYLAWVEENRRRVNEATGGRVGYLHIPDMGSAGIREFIKNYFPQIRKSGLIIDVRSNGGGNVSGMILERLRRQVLMLDVERHQQVVDPYPTASFYGHLVCLLDEDTASDGDQFAHAFRLAGLGPLIGKRSWGGVVGIYGRDPLIDGGTVSVPESGNSSLEGQWVIEGHGVDPDIVVENDPKELIHGRDQQLEKGIEVILEKLARDPKRLPERPAPPVKTEGKP